MPIGIIINALCIFVGGFIGLFRPKFYQRTYHHQPEYDFRTLLHGNGYQLNCPYGKYACGYFCTYPRNRHRSGHSFGIKSVSGALMMEKASSELSKAVLLLLIERNLRKH